MANLSQSSRYGGSSLSRSASGLLQKGRRYIKFGSLKYKDPNVRSAQQEIYWRGRLAFSRRKRAKKIALYLLALVALVLVLYFVFR